MKCVPVFKLIFVCIQQNTGAEKRRRYFALLFKTTEIDIVIILHIIQKCQEF